MGSLSPARIREIIEGITLLIEPREIWSAPPFSECGLKNIWRKKKVVWLNKEMDYPKITEQDIYEIEREDGFREEII